MEELYILRCCLGPQIKAMHLLLESNAPTVDHACWQRMAAGDISHTRLQALCRAGEPEGIFGSALVDTMCILSNKPRWQHLVPTEAVAATIMQMALRSAATIYQNLVQRCRAFPLVLFGALDDPAKLRELRETVATFPCLADPWSQAFFEVFDTDAKVTSESAKLALATMSNHSKGNSYGTECLHSRHSRRSRTRCQTHVMKLHHLALWHHGRVVPRWLPGDLPIDDEAAMEDEGHDMKKYKWQNAEPCSCQLYTA